MLTAENYKLIYASEYFVHLFQLRRAVVDHVSDSFIETIAPILVLLEAAKAGNEREVEEYSGIFQDHASKLIEVGQHYL